MAGRLKFRHMYGRRTVRHSPRFAQGEADEPRDEDFPQYARGHEEQGVAFTTGRSSDQCR